MASPDEQLIIKIDLDSGSISDNFKRIEDDSRSASEGVKNNFEKNINKSLVSLNDNLKDLNRQLNQSAAGTLSAIFAGLAQAAVKAGGGLVGTTVSLGAISASLLTAYEALKTADNAFIRFSSTLILIAGIITGTLSLAIGYLIVKIGELLFLVGNKLVSAFQSASDVFVKADKQLIVFSKTIENYNKITDGASGTTEVWTETISDLSSQLNLSQIELQKAAVEIVGVTSKLGLNEDQMKQLLKITAEYSKVTGKDLFDTTVAFAGALSGNAQAVTQYGVKLTEASNQQFIFKKGLNDSFQSLSEGEKAQVRYNNLLTQYAGIAGVAESVAASLSDQQNAFQIKVENINRSLGKGAAIIENNNILYSLAAKAISGLNSTFLEFFGFIGAIGARLIQVGGFFLYFSFQIYAVIKAVTILDLLLSKDITQSAFAKSIPILGSSLNQLITKLTGVNLVIRSTKDLILALGLILRNQAILFINFFTGVGGAASGLGGILATVGARIGQVLSVLGTGVRLLLTLFGPLAAIIASVIAAFILLKNAFESIEERTGVFSSLFKSLGSELSRLGGIFDPIAKAFDSFKAFLTDTGQRAFGVFVYAISKGSSVIIESIASVGALTKLFSKEFTANLKTAADKLNSFNDNLIANNFKLQDSTQRTIASVNKTFKAVNLEDLAKLREDLADVGKTDIQKLKENQKQRLDLITNALAQQLITEQEFNRLRLLINQDFAIKQKEILDKDKLAKFSPEIQALGIDISQLTDLTNENAEAFYNLANSLAMAGVNLSLFSITSKKDLDELSERFNNIGNATRRFFESTITTVFSTIGAAFVRGKNAFDGFGKQLLSMLGDFAIQVGVLVIGIGKAATSVASALTNFFTGPLAIAAGAALIVLGGALKAMSGGPSGAGSFTASAPSDFGTPGEFEPSQIVNQQQKPQTTVIIQGDVLDSDNTGSRIVDLIRQYTDKNGETVLT